MLELRANQGSHSAMDALVPKEYPESLGYLLDWSRELVGRSGVGMDGAAPLSWETLNAWCARTGRNPTPDDCAALMALDHVMLHPDEPEKQETPNEPTPVVVNAWPTRKQ